MFIFPYMFRATMCPSSGEITVPMGHLVFVTLCGWQSVMQGGFIPPCIPDSHPYRVINTKCRIGSYFSWWWAHSRPKHLQKRNKHTKKNCAPKLVLFTRLPNQYLLLQPTCPVISPYPTAFPYGNGMVLHFYQQQESSTTKTVHKVINKRLKTYV